MKTFLFSIWWTSDIIKMAEKLYEKGITFFINNLNSVNVLSVKNVATNNHYG